VADAAQGVIEVLDLGRLPYAQAYAEQVRRLDAVLARRESTDDSAGYLLLVEHDPVITVSRRPGTLSNLIANPAILAEQGVDVQETDRGGDITYHGPGQLVAYPILDLNLLNLGIHDYMRLLEDAIISTCREFGVHAEREPGATGVWVPRSGQAAAKVCAMGVRVRRWITMHGLALNVTTDLRHFDLIVPCGLAGRAVTSLRELLGDSCPTMDRVKSVVTREIARRVEHARLDARARRAPATSGRWGESQGPAGP
jgi:lipoyl(octanoyl) transferase